MAVSKAGPDDPGFEHSKKKCWLCRGSKKLHDWTSPNYPDEGGVEPCTGFDCPSCEPRDGNHKGTIRACPVCVKPKSKEEQLSEALLVIEAAHKALVRVLCGACGKSYWNAIGHTCPESEATRMGLEGA